MNNNQPIFQQIMETIESDILTGIYKTNDLIISTTQIAKVYSVNHTTAVKAISKLTDAGILYKKRGIGMCVAEGAKEKISTQRKDVFLNQTIKAVLTEAKNLDIPLENLITAITTMANTTNSKGAPHDPTKICNKKLPQGHSNK